MQLDILQGTTVLGDRVTKFEKGSVHVSYSPSAGSWCWDKCGMYNNGCYAVNVEKRYPLAGSKMVRHQEAGMAAVTDKGMAECQRITAKGKRIPWIRFSVFGAVNPKPSAKDRKSLVRFAKWIAENEIPHHFPIESPTKAALYRRLLGKWLTIRESCQSWERWMTAPGPCSIVIGTKGLTEVEKLEEAKAAARARAKATGDKVAVCAYEAESVVRRLLLKAGAMRRAKCGTCKICYRRYMSVVFIKHN